jgi:hypothetical protein
MIVQMIITDKDQLLVPVLPPQLTMVTSTTYSDMNAAKAQMRELDAPKVKVTLRYARTQLYGRWIKLMWKMFNDQNITMQHKKEMFDSFKQNSMLALKDNTTISMAMDKLWIKMLLYIRLLEGLRMEDLPALELMEAGQKAMEAAEFQLLEGLGRQGGAELLWKEMEAQKMNAAMMIKKLRAVKGNVDNSAEIARLEWEVAYIMKWQEPKCQWVLLILNKGESESMCVGREAIEIVLAEELDTLPN